MTKNMGNVDRIVRVLIALAVIVLFATNVISGTVALILGVVAGIFVLTSLVGTCPLYRLFGISSCKMPEQKA
ncbi:MAG: DUF2892 domain-containing protein [Bacteroidota bacterium]